MREHWRPAWGATLFRWLLGGYLALFSANAVLGWVRPPFPDATARAPEFADLAGAVATILRHNFGALVVLVLGNALSLGVFGAVMFAANGYLAGALMRAAAPHAPPWLWLFVVPEMLAFTTAGAAAVSVVIGTFGVGAAARAIGFSVGVLCAAAVFEAVLIQLAWGL